MDFRCHCNCYPLYSIIVITFFLKGLINKQWWKESNLICASICIRTKRTSINPSRGSHLRKHPIPNHSQPIFSTIHYKIQWLGFENVSKYYKIIFFFYTRVPSSTRQKRLSRWSKFPGFRDNTKHDITKYRGPTVVMLFSWRKIYICGQKCIIRTSSLVREMVTSIYVSNIWLV